MIGCGQVGLKAVQEGMMGVTEALSDVPDELTAKSFSRIIVCANARQAGGSSVEGQTGFAEFEKEISL